MNQNKVVLLFSLATLVTLAGCSPKPKLNVTALKCKAGNPGLLIQGQVKNISHKTLRVSPSYTLLSASGDKLKTSSSGNAIGDMELMPGDSSPIAFTLSPRAMAGGGPDTGRNYWAVIKLLHKTGQVRLDFKDSGNPLPATGKVHAACPPGLSVTQEKTVTIIRKALYLASSLKAEENGYRGDNGKFPSNNNEAGAPSPASLNGPGVAQVAIGGNHHKPGTIAVQFKNSGQTVVPKLAGTWLYMSPVIPAQGGVTWRCTGKAVDLSYVTHSCQNKLDQ